MIQFRAGRKFYSIPGLGFAAYAPAAAAVVPWYLTGGIAAANCIGAYQAKGAASQAASYVNLVTPGTYDLTEGSAPGGWDTSYGWNFTTHTQWLDTHITPSPGSWSGIIRFSDLSGGGNYYLFGCYDGTTSHHWDIAPSTSSTVSYNNGAQLGVAPAHATGTLGFAVKAAFRDGAANGTIGAGGAAIARTVAIGNLNYSSRTYGVIAKIQAFAIYDADIVAAFPVLHAAMMAL